MPARTVTVAGQPVTLDARPDRLDLRDLPFRPVLACLPPQYPADEVIAQRLPGYLKASLILDQGKEGACTGFGLAATINYLLWLHSGMTMGEADRVSPRMLYQLARMYDEWPGENYEGSSCRGALKGWHKHGICTNAFWPLHKNNPDDLTEARPGWDEDAVKRPLGVYYRIERQSVVDLQAAIHETGAIYVSGNVHQGWRVATDAAPSSLAALPVIQPDDRILGGHAFALVGYNGTGFVVQNSWGPSWGASGFAILTYEDWVANGTDAWAVGIGVPVARTLQGQRHGEVLRSPSHYLPTVAKDQARAELPGWLGGEDRLANRPDAWPSCLAYTHTLVAGKNGGLVNRLVNMPSTAAAASLVCVEQPDQYFKSNKDKPRRVVVYAHGGLNSEADSIARIRVMGPCFENNGIYPIFLTWKSGWSETLADMLNAASIQAFGTAVLTRGIGKAMNEAWDRAVEVMASGLLASSMWTEMKQNVSAGMSEGHDLSILSEKLAELARRSDGAGLEVHLVGHSAGAFVCGRLLSLLRATDAARRPRIGSCTLYAPACDLAFALDHFKGAIDGGMLQRDRLHVFTLSDARELDDTVGPYTKSLLYLISRALDGVHKTPLLGLASAFDADRTNAEFWNPRQLSFVEAWQDFFWQQNRPRGFAAHGKGLPNGSLHILDARQVDTGPCRIKANHGSFDNSIDILDRTLRRILDVGPEAALAAPVRNLSY